MKYDFYCFTCMKNFTLEMSLDDYLNHMPKRTSKGTIISKFFECTNCGSRDTKRKYTSPYVIYVGDGFTKSVKDTE